MDDACVKVSYLEAGKRIGMRLHQGQKLQVPPLVVQVAWRSSLEVVVTDKGTFP
jgi:hypothetical protein